VFVLMGLTAGVVIPFAQAVSLHYLTRALFPARGGIKSSAPLFRAY
jgi:hypothetical protein